VHDALTVRVRRRVGDLAGEAGGLLERELSFASQSCTQGLALDVGHRVPEHASVLAAVEHGEDVRVLEAGREADLAQEALAAKLGSEVGTEELERDQPVVLQVAGEPDRGHAAAPELALDPVAVREGLRQCDDRRIRHARSRGNALMSSQRRACARRPVAIGRV
jgi:hypothetical protein